MAENAREFVDSWIEENIQPTGYQPEGDRTEAERLAAACLIAAKSAGVSEEAIQNEIGDLVAYMDDAIERANNAEVRRLVDKDD